MGDTLASELDILSSTPPILFITLKTVPWRERRAFALGTATSIGGGMAMGWAMWATLSVENAACRDQTGSLFLPCRSTHREHVAVPNTNYCNKSPGVKGACQRPTAELCTPWQNGVLLGVLPTRYLWPHIVHLWLASCSCLTAPTHEVQLKKEHRQSSLSGDYDRILTCTRK